MKKGDKNSIDYFAGNYKARAFENEFYDKFADIVRKFRENHPNSPLQKVSLVLPDCVFLTDSVNIPVLNKRAMETSLSVSLANLYSNSAEIKFNHQLSAQNKQFATYSIIGVRRDILARLRDVCSKNQISISNITYSSNAAVNGAFIVNPRLKNDSFVLLDIKDNSSKIIFVVKGKTMGYYTLPFGSSMLYKTRVAAEDMLFDHSPADLLVLNAKEKAKAKALTLSDEKPNVLTDEEAGNPVIIDKNAAAAAESAQQTVTEEALSEEEDLLPEDKPEEELRESPEFVGNYGGFRKAPRKLPKYMLRDTPSTREGFVCENFRYFVKWTLDVIASNSGITSFGAPEAVYVNLPIEYNFIYNTVNEEFADNKIRFVPLFESEIPSTIQQNLDLFGALYAKQFNKINNFHSNQLDVIKSKSAKKNEATEKAENAIDSIVEKLKKLGTPQKKDKKSASPFKEVDSPATPKDKSAIPMMDKFFKKNNKERKNKK